jgi:hypothetical protein
MAPGTVAAVAARTIATPPLAAQVAAPASPGPVALSFTNVRFGDVLFTSLVSVFIFFPLALF